MHIYSPARGETWTRMAPLEPGLPFEYLVLQDGTEVFRAEAKALKGPGQAQQVAVAGDLAGDGPAAMIRQIHQQNPDLMIAAGGLVPPPDSLARYRQTFFSRYNAGRTDPKAGAPFMRSTVLVGAPGQAEPGAEHRGRPAYAAPSCSLLDISASRVVLRQIDGRGATLDHFTLKR